MKKKWFYFLLIGILTIGGFLFYGLRQPSIKYPHTLAICAMFKNEAPWLKEWIEYHRLLGATHFYLYNNDSTDTYDEVLQPYIDLGVVELIDWSSSKEEHAIRGYDNYAWVPFQIGAYNDCLKHRALSQALWVAVIDIDEFLVPVLGFKSFQTLLEQEARNGTGSLKLFWRVFGTSNIWDLRKDELLTEKLSLRALDHHPWNRNVKSLYRPEAVEICLVHTHERLKKGYKKKRLNPDLFRVHHYWTRTGKCLAQKRNLSEQESTQLTHEFNSIEDYSISPFLPALRQIMHSSQPYN
ncbi:MAG: glycosyltransferase family 92 protein [Simkania sp.]|nr:glycosyltransferase family 92 protein [Simkania sp.]